VSDHPDLRYSAIAGTVFLFLVGVVAGAVVFPIPVWADTNETDFVWFRSNPVGSRLEQLDRADREQTISDNGERHGETAEHTYLLRVLSNGSREQETLLKNGVVVRERIRELGVAGRVHTEIVSDSDGYRSEMQYDDSGRIHREVLFARNDRSGGGEYKTYRYLNGMLVEIETREYDGSPGEILHRDLFLYFPDGRIRQLRREYPDGSVRVSEYLYRGNLVREESHIDGSAGVHLRYDDEGRISRREEWDRDDGETVYEYIYADSDPKRSHSGLVVRTASDTVERRTFDEKGREIHVRIERSGRTMEEIRREFGEHGILREVVIRRRGNIETQYGYDEDGQLSEERRIVNGVVESDILYRQNGLREELRYRAGEPVLRVYFDNDRRVREEVIQGGRVVETREIPER
jgi:YD repeat-containing protein